MRIERETTVDASRARVWELVSNPVGYPAFFHGITRFGLQGEVDRGLGARFSMRMRVGSADVGGLVEIVEFDEPADMAWTSITGIDQRGRWRSATRRTVAPGCSCACPTVPRVAFSARSRIRCRSRWWRGISSERCTI
jgi:carbon monoxide dehydrogenase subunit G